MKKITCVTPTGGRSEIFQMTKRCMESQTMQPDQWLVIDDGLISLSEKLRTGMDYIRRLPVEKKGHTLSKNIKKAIPLITGDFILIIEDDDWYSPKYIETMYKHLHNHILVGEGCARYYHVPGQRYARLHNKQHASFSQTGFDKSLLPSLDKVLKGDAYIDMRFWKKLQPHGFLFYDTADRLKLHCSLKGLPGRAGIGCGHDRKLRAYSHDRDYSALKYWVGNENAQWYIDCCNKEASNGC